MILAARTGSSRRYADELVSKHLLSAPLADRGALRLLLARAGFGTNTPQSDSCLTAIKDKEAFT